MQPCHTPLPPPPFPSACDALPGFAGGSRLQGANSSFSPQPCCHRAAWEKSMGVVQQCSAAGCSALGLQAKTSKTIHHLQRQTCCCVAAREKVIGWYSTGPRLREADQDINDLVSKYVETPLLVICEVQVTPPPSTPPLWHPSPLSATAICHARACQTGLPGLYVVCSEWSREGGGAASQGIGFLGPGGGGGCSKVRWKAFPGRACWNSA